MLNGHGLCDHATLNSTVPLVRPLASALWCAAFLNTSSGGTLYLGVSDAGKVIGVRLSRHQRDRFRQGIFSTICRGISPPVLPDKLQVSFIAVVGAPLAPAEQPDLKSKLKAVRNSRNRRRASSKVSPPEPTATPSPLGSDAEEAELEELPEPRTATPAAKPDPEPTPQDATLSHAVPEQSTANPATPHAVSATAPAPPVAGSVAPDPDRDLFVVEIWVEPGLSMSQPVAYENSRSRAFLRLPGSTVVMTGGERIELFRRCAGMDGPMVSSPRGRGPKAAIPADRAKSRTCALL